MNLTSKALLLGIATGKDHFVGVNKKVTKEPILWRLAARIASHSAVRVGIERPRT